MAEWLKALAWKACIRETVSWADTPSANAIVTRRRPRHGPHPVILHDVKQPAAWPDAQPISFPRRIFCARVVASCLLCLHRISAAFADASAGEPAEILGVSCSSGPEMRGPAERREAYYLSCRARRARRSRLRGVGVPRNRDSASRRSTVALAREPFRLRHICRIRPVGCSRPAIVMAGYGTGLFVHGFTAAIDATPRSACWIVSGDAPHERG